MTTAETLAEALRVIRRLADPTEIAGFGDADALHNNTMEGQARLRYAKREYERLSGLVAAESDSRVTRDAEVLHSEHHPGTLVPSLDSCPEHGGGVRNKEFRVEFEDED